MTELEYSEFLKGETDLEREASLYFLEHHGVENQKWGVRNGPPYPIQRGKDGKPTKTQKKKKASLLSRVTSAAKKKKQAAEKAKKKKEAAEEKKKTEDNEKIREKVLKSSDPKYIEKYMDLLSTKELQERIDRINKEKTMRDLAHPKKKDPVKSGEDFLKSTASMTESMLKIYNAYNAVQNSRSKMQNKNQQSQGNQNKQNQNKTFTGSGGQNQSSSTGQFVPKKKKK